MNMLRVSTFVGAVSLFVLSACQGNTSPSDLLDPSLRGGSGSGGGSTSNSLGARVRCEVRTGTRSKVSVDGNNLRPRGGVFTARITSGSNSAVSPAATAIGDEVEFDFDSDPGDIRAGATAIDRNFIVGGAVSAEILDADGQVAASGSASCRVR